MEKNWFEQNWTMLLLRGVLAVIFGIMAIVWPAITALALAVLWGVWALVDGIAYLAAAFRKDASGRAWLIVAGIVAVLAGIVAVIHPLDVAVILTWILGIWFVVSAIVQAMGAFSSTHTQPRWLLIVAAVLSLLLGILFISRPGAGVLAIVLWVGVLAIIWGGILIATALGARSFGKELDATVRPAPGPGPA